MTEPGAPVDLTDIGDSEERYRAVIDALAEGIVLQNQEGTILASNASAARILQMTTDELHGRTSLDPEWRAIQEDGAPFVGSEHPAMVTLRTGSSLSNVVMGVRRGKEVPTWISINTRPLHRPGAAAPYAVVCSFADITGAKALENEIRRSEEKYRSLFEHSRDGILLLRPDGGIWAANQAACLLLRRTETELVQGGSDSILDREDPRLSVALAERARTGSVAAELTFVRGDGKKIPVEVTSTSFAGADGEQRTSILFRDITERLRLDRMKSEFLATVSHELRTPLTTVSGALGLLAGGVFGPLPEAAGDYVRMATNGAERLTLLLSDMIELASFDSGTLTLCRLPVDSAQLVSAAIDRVQPVLAAAEATLDVQAPVQAALCVDASRILQVLAHLISNAVKFSSPGSEVLLSVGIGSSGRLRFAVTDRGGGIDANHVPQLFSRFHQVDSSDARHNGGTGLGLAVSKVLVEAHGGEIGVETSLGRGSTFWFELDRHEH